MSKIKYSGVEWIGDIPNEWNTNKLKNCTKEISSGGTPESSNNNYYDDINGIPWVAIGDMSSNIMVNNTAKKITESGLKSKQLKVYPKGTLLYSIFATIGKTALLNIDAAINQAILAIIPNNLINKIYLKYQLNAMEEYVIADCSTNTQSNLNSTKVRSFNITLPNIKEQEIIASFLDQKVAELNKIVNDINKQIEILDNYKKAIITEKVTKGLDEKTKYKDSGIDWIGKIPYNWKLTKNKYQIAIHNGREIEFEDGEIDVFGTGGLFKKTNEYLFDGESVLLGRKGTIDNPMYVNQKFWIVDTCYYTTAKKDLNMKLFYYFACCFDYKYYQTGSTLPSMTQYDLNSIYLPDIPNNQQKEIVEYLDKKCSQIDKIIEDKQKQVDKIEEYKKSVIYEYVTGKKRVEGAEELYG